MNSSQALVGRDHPFAPAKRNTRDPWQRLAQLEAELGGAGAGDRRGHPGATAFRLRDEAG